MRPEPPAPPSETHMFRLKFVIDAVPAATENGWCSPPPLIVIGVVDVMIRLWLIAGKSCVIAIANPGSMLQSIVSPEAELLIKKGRLPATVGSDEALVTEWVAASNAVIARVEARRAAVIFAISLTPEPQKYSY
jgi:hypothetical protein